MVKLPADLSVNLVSCAPFSEIFPLKNFLEYITITACTNVVSDMFSDSSSVLHLASQMLVPTAQVL